MTAKCVPGVPSATCPLSPGGPMPDDSSGERVTPVLDFPFRDGLTVNAVRVDYAPGGFTRGTHRHPSGAYVYVMEGSVLFGVDGGAPALLKARVNILTTPEELRSLTPTDN